MSLLRWSSLGAIAGMLAGWLADEVSKPVETSQVVSEETEVVTPRRPIRRVDPRLSSVEACRAALAEAAAGKLHPLLRHSKRDAALRRWLELDPDDALKEILADPGGTTAKDLLLAWIEVDPVRAMDAMHEVGPAVMRPVAQEMFVKLLVWDPELAMSELRSDRWNAGAMTWNDDRFKASVYEQWMAVDLPSATGELRRMFQKGGWETNLDATRALFAGWSRVDFQAAWGFLTAEAATAGWMAESNARGELGEDLRERVLKQGLLEGSKEAEMELIRFWEGKGPSAMRGSDSPGSMLRDAIDRDPYRVLEFAEGLDPRHDDIRKDLCLSVIGEISHSDPIRALDMFKRTPPDAGDYRKTELRQIFASLVNEDPARARTELVALPTAFQVPAIGGWLTSEFASDPEAAIRRCREWAADPAVAEALGKGWAMAFSWGHGSGIRDPKPSLDAMPELNDAVDCDVLSTWVKGNPREAATWISTRIADGHQVDFGKEGILGDLSNSEPQWMSGWVNGVLDANVREKAVRTLAKNWMAFDPQGAGEWLDSLPAGKTKVWADDALADYDD